jgi:hypothetical protein
MQSSPLLLSSSSSSSHQSDTTYNLFTLIGKKKTQETSQLLELIKIQTR